jgi:hypothetical protein
MLKDEQANIEWLMHLTKTTPIRLMMQARDGKDIHGVLSIVAIMAGDEGLICKVDKLGVDCNLDKSLRCHFQLTIDK